MLLETLYLKREVERSGGKNMGSISERKLDTNWGLVCIL